MNYEFIENGHVWKRRLNTEKCTNCGMRYSRYLRAVAASERLLKRTDLKEYIKCRGNL